MFTIQQKKKFLLSFRESLTEDDKREIKEFIRDNYKNEKGKYSFKYSIDNNTIIVNSKDLFLGVDICESIQQFCDDKESVTCLIVYAEKETEGNSCKDLRDIVKINCYSEKIAELYNICFIYTEEENDYLIKMSGMKDKTIQIEITSFIYDYDGINEEYDKIVKIINDITL